MKKIFLAFCLIVIQVYAVESHAMIGQWKGENVSKSDGTITTETTYLTLKNDKTFELELTIHLKKGLYWLKDLKIIGSGVWRVYEDKVIYTFNKVYIANQGTAFKISYNSVKFISDYYYRQLSDEPIHLFKVEMKNRGKILLFDEQGRGPYYKISS